MVCYQYSSVEDGRYWRSRICAKFVATPLVKLRSYAYVMKQADKEGSRSSDETLLCGEKSFIVGNSWSVHYRSSSLVPSYPWSIQRSTSATCASEYVLRLPFCEPCAFISIIDPWSSRALALGNRRGCGQGAITWLHHGNTFWACALYNKMAYQTRTVINVPTISS